MSMIRDNAIWLQCYRECHVVEMDGFDNVNSVVQWWRWAVKGQEALLHVTGIERRRLPTSDGAYCLLTDFINKYNVMELSTEECDLTIYNF